MWRSHRGMAGGVPDTAIGSVGQGQGGYGDKTGDPGGYNAASAYESPTGYLDPPGHLSADPAMRQVGGYTGPLTEGTGGDGSSEFGKEPPQVQSAAGGPQHGPAEAQERTAETARRAIMATFDDLGSATFRADLASARHETQYTRLFRS